LGAVWLIEDYRSARYSGYLVLAMGIAGGLGGVEIMTRYRQAPLRALMSTSGLVFVAVNAAAAAVAWYFLHVMQWMPSYSPPTAGFCVKSYNYCEETNVKATVIAGFGALVFLRASIFKVRVNDADVGVGPAALLDSLLLIADRGVDRREAVARSRDVEALVSRMKSVEDRVSVARLLGKYSLALMQNVDDSTRNDVEKALKEALSDADTPNSIKLDIVALKLGVVVGRDVLEAAASALKARLDVVGVSIRDLAAEIGAAVPRNAPPP
jgi:hypothetical protein